MRDVIRDLPGSKIREVANAGLGREDVLAFWFGESDEGTSHAVSEVAIASIRRGETFYSHNLGLIELRESIAGYVSGLHRPVTVDRVAVTSSGVNALMVAMQALVGAGDEVVAVVPVWPNLTAQPQILGARVRPVSLVPREGRWELDLQRLIGAITPATRVLLVNSPNNPTGWTLSAEEQRALLEHCRKTGTWIVADEVYERLYYVDGARAAPSFLDLCEDEDRVVVVHSFSKAFLMTGWRLGNLVVPRGMLDALGKLLEFNTSCAPVFVQRAGIEAIARAAQDVPPLVGRLRHCRDTVLDALQRLPRVQCAVPSGGMYAFFRVEGEGDSLAFAKRLVAEHGLGLAPGAAFGTQSEGWLRWCFASRDPGRLCAGVMRLEKALRL
jgi:aspartate/methionine/tyrosine aminotransferase